MKHRIILITNTAPYSGEVFLQRELEFVPEDQMVTVFPVLLEHGHSKHALSRSNVEVIPDGSFPSPFHRIFGLAHGLCAPFFSSEWKAILSAPNPLRNWIKAVKFAALSESRALTIRKELRRRYPGERFVFYSYWLYEAAYAAARLRRQFPGSRFVSRCHGYDLYEQRHPNGYLPFRHFLLSCADGIFPVSQDGAAYLSKRYPAETAGKLRLMRLGTEDHGLSVGSREDGTLILVSCSNVVEVKRVDRIADALALMGRSIHWYHFGDGPLLNQIKEKAALLPPHIHCDFPGNVPNDQLLDFYSTKHIDVFVNVSSSEGVPVSIMEAMSFGIPVIATDVGGTSELVVLGETGILLPADFTDQNLAGAIEGIIPQRHIYGQNARLRWQQQSNAQINYTAFYQALDKE